MTHWLTRWDPDDGEPYGTICGCDIDADHDGTGEPMFPETPDAGTSLTEIGLENLGHGGAPTSANW